MRDYMMALHQRFCKEPECREVKTQLLEIEQELHQKLDRQGQERTATGYDQNGKRIIKNVPGRTQAEVKAKLSVAIAESQQLDVSRSGEYTVAEWLRL